MLEQAVNVIIMGKVVCFEIRLLSENMFFSGQPVRGELFLEIADKIKLTGKL